MSSFNEPRPMLGPAGYVAPAESAILTAVQTGLNTAFGTTLNPSLDTPQGQLATSITAVIGDKNDLFLEYTNQVDPQYADGRMQDAIARIYFLTRKPALATVVQCTCVGLPGTAIPVGSLARDEAGNIFASLGAAVIGAGGSVSIQFACTKTGPIVVDAGTVNRIYQAIPGWDTVSNPAGGVTGRNIESRAEFEERRNASVAINSIGPLGAVRGGVWAVSGVSDVYTLENNTASAVTTNGVSIDPHGVYIAVVGGTDQAVAEAIFQRLNIGAPMTGTTSVTVFDTQYATPPYPSTVIKFQRPAPRTVTMQFHIANVPGLPATLTDLVAQAVVNATASGTDKQRLRIGRNVFISDYFAAVQAVDPDIEIVAGFVDGGTSTVAAITGLQVPTVTTADISVVLV